MFLAAFMTHFDLEAELSLPPIVLEERRIEFNDYPDAFNPSMLKVPEGVLMSFRYCPDVEHNCWLSYIGLVLLNEQFEPKGPPQLMMTRPRSSYVRSQSEDARLFRWNGRIYLIYNDNMDMEMSSLSDRRDMYVAEVRMRGNRFTVSPPLKLVYEERYGEQVWQKNWVPFEWNRKLLMSYSLDPHEVLTPNWVNGNCNQVAFSNPFIEWDWGVLRGSTPAIKVEGEYLAFFHSSQLLASSASWDYPMYHYFMGAYTFAAEPPFQMQKISSRPIVGPHFYTHANYYKRVVFPGGFWVQDDRLYITYGKDDQEIWVATLDYSALKASLRPVD